MKKALSLLLVILMAISVIACGNNNAGNTANSGNAGSSSTSTSTETKTETKTESKTESAPSRTDVKIPLSSVGSTLDPHAATLLVDLQVTAQMYEGLFRLNDDGVLESRLAEKYEVSADGLEYTFPLRKGVVFHNGDPFTAADVAWSFQRCIDNSYKKTLVRDIDKIDIVDDYTIKVTLKTPNSTFPTGLAYLMILNKNVVEQLGNTYGVTSDDAGTGPYRMENFDQTTKITLKAFPEYYLGKASIETVEFVPMLDNSTQLIAFESGQFDFCTINAADWEMIKSSGKYNTAQAPGKQTTFVCLNVAKKDSPFYDVRVRQAVGYCMNKDDMVAIAAEGLADVAYYMVRPVLIPGAVETGKFYTQDLEKAKALLAEAGYPNGFDCQIDVITGANNRYIKVAEVLQENLAAIGINANIVSGEAATILAAFKNEKTYDIGISGVTWDYSYNEYMGWINGINTANSQFDLNENIDVKYIQDLGTKALAASSQEEQDKYFGQVAEYDFEVAGYLPVLYMQSLYAWNKDLNAKPPVGRYYVYEWSWN